MKKLVFKLDYAGKILSGEKTTTIRLSTNLKEGDMVEIYVGHVRIGKAIIKKIYRKKLKDLTLEEIKNDGFKSIDELMTNLAKIYGSRRINTDSEVYVINFQLY